jgi:Domain of unknown function (DUF1937)
MYKYLASPYTHADSDVMENRYIQARNCTAWLLSLKIWVYSPIVHCHELAKYHELPRDADYWWEYNKAMLEPASELIVLALDGWQDSTGVAKEVGLADRLKKSISFISPKTYQITPDTELK